MRNLCKQSREIRVSGQRTRLEEATKEVAATMGLLVWAAKLANT